MNVILGGRFKMNRGGDIMQRKREAKSNYQGHVPVGCYEKYLKRPFDASVAMLALIVLSPVFLIITVLVKVKLGSPVLFSQERPGKDGKIFKLYKFRSMLEIKDKNGDLLSDDDRLTPFGRTLRSTSLDELPELLNILRGDMSLIGPRPLLTEYLPYYTEEESHRHDIRPGLTGLAQVNGRNSISWEEKFEWDLKYVNNIRFLEDIKILLLTVGKTIKRSDILVGKQYTEGRLDIVRKQM